jgi:iron complex outermembrane receptor protein
MNRITFAVKSALGLVILAPASMAFAQTAADSGQLEEVIVTGIRQSLDVSLEQKRKATDLVEVITAEDIGKMPDKNIADSLQRVPGLTTSSSGATEGGFDENDRVSMRGTNPSLTQTLIDGHNVAAGDWFVLDQTGTVGRSVSYTLLPSELVGEVVVHKSSEASLVEGGVAGSVDIITRKPLDFTKPLTLEVSAGAVYADLPAKTDPQLSGLFNWQDSDKNFGVLLQGFYEKRHLERQGAELLGYDTIAPGSAIALQDPNLSGVQYPTDIDEAFFTQTRTRTGGLLDLQWKPNDDLSFNLSALLSNLLASNYNRSYLQWDTHFIASGAGQAPNPGYVVSNNTLVSATFAPVAGTAYGIYDQISRPDESEGTYFINLDGSWHASDRLTFTGQVGFSEGSGKTPEQNVAETEPGVGNGASYTLHGVGSGPSWNLGDTNNTTPSPGGVPVAFGWIFGAQNVDVIDTEEWLKLDGTFKMNDDGWTDLKFGLRSEGHDRNSVGATAQGPTFGATGGTCTCNYPTGYQTVPSNFDTFGGSVPTGWWYWTPAQLAAYNGPGLTQRGTLARAYPDYWFSLTEKTDALYGQLDYHSGRISGNVGLRVVSTQENIVTWEQDSSVTATTPGAVTSSLFGPYVARRTDNTYYDVLPSANLKIELQDDLVARFAAAETMTRPDYSALATATQLGGPPAGTADGTGTTGNPNLHPVRSANLDAGLEWYFMPHSLLSATAFYMDLQNYISYGSELKNYLVFGAGEPAGGGIAPYDVTIPVDAAGRVYGAEFNYVQALGDHFGLAANYTYADGRQTSGPITNGDTRLVGTSKNTYNLTGYYEDQHFNARVAYNFRSAFYSGLDRSTAFTQDDTAYLSASLGYTVNDNIAITLDGQNLNNPTLKYYALDPTQPRAFYTNGRQYYLNLRMKL